MDLKNLFNLENKNVVLVGGYMLQDKYCLLMVVGLAGNYFYVIEKTI